MRERMKFRRRCTICSASATACGRAAGVGAGAAGQSVSAKASNDPSTSSSWSAICWNNFSKPCGASSARWNRQYSLERTSSNSKTMHDGCKTPCTMRAVRDKTSGMRSYSSMFRQLALMMKNSTGASRRAYLYSRLMVSASAGTGFPSVSAARNCRRRRASVLESCSVISAREACSLRSCRMSPVSLVSACRSSSALMGLSR